MSTTPDIDVARRFGSAGIILVFKCGVNQARDISQMSLIPKYLSVARFSVFPEEKELLFYGENVIFRIYDIIEGHNNKSHRAEVRCLNLFQRLIKNQAVESEDYRTSLPLLLSMIKRQKQVNMKYYEKDEEKVSDDDTLESKEEEYGQALFGYFVNNSQAHSIEIQKFESLESELKNELFSADGNLSFLPICILFGSLKELTLTDSCIDRLDLSKSYVEAAFECIKALKSQFGRSLSQITFQSERHNANAKQNPDLKALQYEFNEKFKENQLQWSIQYKFQGNRHCVVFRHQQEAFIQELISEYEEKIRKLKEENSKLSNEVIELKSKLTATSVNAPK